MSSIRNIVLCGLFACFGLWPAQASAQPNASFSIPVHGVLLEDDASMTLSGPALNGGAGANVTFNFVLPRDYVNNTEVKVVLSLRSISTGCGIYLAAWEMARSRAGRAEVVSLDGLTAPNPVINPTSTNVFLKAFKINPGGAFTDQKRGDAISLHLARLTGEPQDNCPGALIISGIEVLYTAP